jgi:hypothetical protein
MKQDALKQPLFAKLLEDQRTIPNEPHLAATKPPWVDEAHTHKYPSDGDDDIEPIEY